MILQALPFALLSFLVMAGSPSVAPPAVRALGPSSPLGVDPRRCPRAVDVVFVVDESGSVCQGQSPSDNCLNWQRLRSFTADISLLFPVGPWDVVPSFIGYSGVLTKNFLPLEPDRTGTQFADTVRSFLMTNGGTATALALQAAEREFNLRGRSVQNGTSRMVIVLTDGLSTNPSLTASTAQDMRSRGILMAAVGIGPAVTVPNSGAWNEMDALAGRPDLVWREGWSQLGPDSPILAALLSAAYFAPISPGEALRNITTTLRCECIVYVRFQVSAANATTLSAEVTGGGPVRMCYSFTNSTPEAPNGGAAPDTVCAAIPPPPATASVLSILPNAAQNFVFVSLRATAGGATCGGTVTITTVAGCSVRFASVVSTPGSGTGNAGAPVGILPPLGNPANRCPSCFGNDVLLAANRSGDAQFAAVCAPACRGGAQYAREGGDPDFPSDGLCTTCHPTCVGDASAGGACEAPTAPTLNAEALSCTACPTGFVLPVGSDPSVTSPFWGFVGARRGRPTPPLAAASGRCVPACPPGFASDGPLLPRPAARTTLACRGDLPAFAATSRTLTVTLCVPAAPGAPPVPPGFNSSLTPNCTAFWGDPWSREGAVAGQLADALGMPRGAVFLRACTDVRERAYYVTRYGGEGEWARVEEPDIASAVANATRRAGSNCSCDVFATFSVLLGVAAPGEPPFGGTFSADEGVMRARAEAALARLLDAPFNTTGVPLGAGARRLEGTERFRLSADRRSLQAAGGPSGGYGPLKCSFNATRLLGACYDDFYYSTQQWGADNVRSRNIISLCGGRPPPEVPGAAPFPFIVEVAAAGGSALGLLFLLLLALLWAKRVTARLAAIAAHRAKVARWRKRGRTGGEGVDGTGEEEEDDWDPSSLDAGLTSRKAVFGLTRVAGAAEPFSAAGMAVALSSNGGLLGAPFGDAGGVPDWVPGGARPTSVVVAAMNPLRAAGGEEGGAVTAVTLAAARRAAVAAAAAGVGTAGAAARKAMLAKAAGSRAPTLEAATEDTFWLGVPYRALSPCEKAWEWAVPGAYTLGMGVWSDTVPPSHDVTHALGPRSEMALALTRAGAQRSDARTFSGLAEVEQLQRENAALEEPGAAYNLARLPPSYKAVELPPTLRPT
jgi:hypothetical protein